MMAQIALCAVVVFGIIGLPALLFGMWDRRNARRFEDED